MGKSKHILFLEPFGDGSHAAFYRQWSDFSRHRFTVLALPAVHWKWRSRHASLTLAHQARALVADGHQFDVVFCSDMLNLPEWCGLAGPLSTRPAIVYFHENQFTYPIAAGQSRDYHFAYSNILTAIAATQLWFNSAFHRDEFASAARIWLRRMPDYKHLELFEQALASAVVCPPGICTDALPTRRTGAATERPLTIGWVARWEHDKRPDLFAQAIAELAARDLSFQLILLGQQFRTLHPSLQAIAEAAGSRVVHAGFAESRSDYWRLLSQMDVVVSTADHEFFGIGILEAVAAGALPLLPNRLSYPEVFQLREHPIRRSYFYSGDVADLVDRLAALIQRHPVPLPSEMRQRAMEFEWSLLARKYDDLLEASVEGIE